MSTITTPITTINSYDTISGSRSTLNANFILRNAKSIRTIVDADSPYLAVLGDDCIVALSTSAIVQVNLPTAASSLHRVISFVTALATGGGLEIRGNGSETINGSNVYTCYNLYDSVTIVSDGTQWVILARKDTGGPTDLSYTAATRVLASSTGADATLPLFTSTDAGLTPSSGGGTSNFLRADGTWTTPAGGGSVTSVGLSAPTGFTVTNSPVTTAGTITLSFTAGYALPTTSSQTNWDTAYTDRLKWDGGATGLVAATGRTSLGLGSLATLSSVSTSNIGDDQVTYAKLQNVSATDKILGRSSAGAGDVEEITCTSAGRNLLDDVDAAAQRTTLGLGTLATQSGTFSGTSSGTNTGDQTITLTGDVTGSGTGSFAATIASGAVTYAKIQDVSATDRLLGRSSAGAGVVQEITCTSAGRNLLDDADASAQRTTLGLGGAATLNVGTSVGTVAAGDDSRFTTDLSYTAATRVLASSTGTDATLPLVTSTDAGLAPASGGGTSNFLRADGTWAAPSGGGTVTSVGLSAPTGFSVANSPVTGSGTLALSFAAGYALPTTTSQTNWDTAYTDRLKWDGGATGLDASTGRTSLGLGSLATLSSVSTSNIGDDQVTYAKVQNVSATDKILGRSSAGAGDIEEITCTSAGRALLDDADATAQRTTLGLGTLATQSGTFSGTSSGTNTGDQTITLTGDVTGSGTGSFAATIASAAVTYSKIQNVSATDKILGRSSAGAGVVQEITCTSAGRDLLDDADASAQRTTLGLGTLATLSSVSTANIGDDQVTYAKIQNVSATDRILGRSSAGAGDIQEITCTSAGRALLDDADATAQRTTLGLGSIATQASSSVTITGGTMSGVQVTDYTEPKSAPTISSGTLTLNLNTAQVFDVSLNANITTLTLSNVDATSNTVNSFTLIFTMDGTARTVTWPTAVKWPGGTAPTLTSTNGKKDVFSFLSPDNGTTWLGFVGGQNF